MVIWVLTIFDSIITDQKKNQKEKKTQKVKCVGRTDGPTKRGVESCSTRLKKSSVMDGPLDRQSGV